MALSDDDFRELQEQSVAARETAQTAGWAVITDRIKAKIAVRQTAMIAGKVKDWEEYQRFANWLDCALWVLRIPDEIDTQVEQNRELRTEEGM